MGTGLKSSVLWEVAELIPTKEEMKEALEIRQGRELTERFSSATVAVCGLGGLGSNIAISLARAGIGKLILIDCDRVDVTNLHRQQYKAAQVGEYKTDALAATLKEIAPYVALESHLLRSLPRLSRRHRLRSRRDDRGDQAGGSRLPGYGL